MLDEEVALYGSLIEDLLAAGRGEYEFQVPAHWSDPIEELLARVNKARTYGDEERSELFRLYEEYVDQMETEANFRDSEGITGGHGLL